MAKNRRPTIIFVAAIAPSLKIFVGEVARELSRRGFRCVAVAGRSSGLSTLRRDFDDVYDITPFRRQGIRAALRATGELARVVRQERAGLLHLHTPYAVALGRVVAHATRTPQLAIVHGTLFDSPSPAGRLFSAIETATAWATPSYVTLNADDLQTYRRIAPRSRVHLAACGGQGVATTDDHHDARQRPGGGGGPRALILGRLTPDKNLDLAVAAWRQARLTVPDLELRIVGSTADGERPWTPPVEPGITVHPWTNDPRAELAGADVLLSTSPREGFPMAITEAVSIGTPVVAVDNRGTRAVVEAVLEGMSLVPANRAAIAAALLTQIRAATVRVRPSALHSWRRDSVVAFHVERILEVLGEPHPPANTPEQPPAVTPEAVDSRG